MPAEPLNGQPAGFFGKLPARGDFVTRRLTRAFVDAWDAWLQEAMTASREALGEGWLDLYLTAPIWRFALAPGVCAPDGIAGVLMPSVDSVGRYYPLTIAQSTGAAPPTALLAEPVAGWFEAAEEVALSALADAFDFDGFDRDVGALGMPAPAVAPTSLAAGRDVEEHRSTGVGWQLTGTPAEAARRFLHVVLRGRHGAYGLWWSAGSERVEPSILVSRGMPPPAGFAAFLDGAWQAHGWWGEEGIVRDFVSPGAAP